jgi:hypothetical protein
MVSKILPGSSNHRWHFSEIPASIHSREPANSAQSDPSQGQVMTHLDLALRYTKGQLRQLALNDDPP